MKKAISLIKIAFAVARILRSWADRVSAWASQRIEESFQRRIEAYAAGTFFTDDELVYSAETLCDCGHGMAYPRSCGPRWHWSCSAELKGLVTDRPHVAPLPFVSYEIKSEQQPSAGGRTTRGVFRPKP